MVDKEWFKKEIAGITKDLNDLYDNQDDQESYEKVRHRIDSLIDQVGDKYGLINAFIINDCEFPFELSIHINGEVRNITCDNCDQLLFNILLLR